jgi:hypothetical protein
MPTTTVDATYQGYIQRADVLGSANWSTTRNAGSGTFAETYTSAVTAGTILSALETARADIVQAINRTFLFFDLDSIPTEAKGNITAATLKVLGAGSNNTADSIPVKASAWGGDGSTSTLSTGNFNALTFGTPYGSEKTSWSTSGYNDYTLNSDAIDDINTVNAIGFGSTYFLNVAVIEHDYDYSNTTPPNPTNALNSVRFLDATNKIKLEITYPDSTQIGEINGIEFNGRFIDNVNGVGFSDIGTIIGV